MLEKLSKLLLALQVICFLAFGWLVYKALNIPKNTTNNITNVQNNDQQQWQATLVFPNRQIPFEYETFVYSVRGKVTDFDKIKEELDSKCVLWNSIYSWSNVDAAIIGCFKKAKTKIPKEN